MRTGKVKQEGNKEELAFTSKSLFYFFFISRLSETKVIFIAKIKIEKTRKHQCIIHLFHAQINAYLSSIWCKTHNSLFFLKFASIFVECSISLFVEKKENEIEINCV